MFKKIQLLILAVHILKVPFMNSLFVTKLQVVVMVAAPLILGGGGLKISDQNNWGVPEQKIKFGGR